MLLITQGGSSSFSESCYDTWIRLAGVYRPLKTTGGATGGRLHSHCECVCTVSLRPLCSVAHNVKRDNGGSVRRPSLCVCVLRGGMAKLRP